MIPDPTTRTNTLLMLAQSFGWVVKGSDTFRLHRGLRSTGELDAERIERMGAQEYAGLCRYLVEPEAGLPGSDPAPSVKPNEREILHADRYDPVDLRILEAIERACEGIQAFGARSQPSELFLYLQAQTASQERILTAFSREAREMLESMLAAHQTKAQNNLELRVAALETKIRN